MLKLKVPSGTLKSYKTVCTMYLYTSSQLGYLKLTAYKITFNYYIVKDVVFFN